MSEALTAVADSIENWVIHYFKGEPYDPAVGMTPVALTAIRRWLEHPDVAGCDNPDCENGVLYRHEPIENSEPCPRCVVKTVGDIPNVRVRKERLRMTFDDTKILAVEVSE